MDAASADYAATIADLLDHLVRDGALMIDLADPIQARIVVTHGRNVLNDAVWQLILAEIAIAGLP
jgi:NAD(P) transhydrogenase subunit alpha